MINLFILEPENISKKYILENKLQQFFYQNNKNIKINYLPSLFPEKKFFNKFFSLISYFKEKEIPKYSFYCDHDVFILNAKIFKNFYENKIFFEYNPFQFFNWQEILNKFCGIKIKIDFKERFSSAIFPLYRFFINDLKLELKLIEKNEKKCIEYSGLVEEFFFSKLIKKFNFKTMPIQPNKYFNYMYIIHFKILDSFIFRLLNKTSSKQRKEILFIIKQLKRIYQEKENGKNKKI